MGFSDDINRFGTKIVRNQRAFNIEFMQDLAQPLIEDTPVDTGFLRQSWAYGVNAPPSEGLAGQGNVRESVLLSSKPGDTYYISNVAEYAGFVEFGTSRMEGRGWVRNVLARAANIAANAARKVNG